MPHEILLILKIWSTWPTRYRRRRSQLWKRIESQLLPAPRREVSLKQSSFPILKNLHQLPRSKRSSYYRKLNLQLKRVNLSFKNWLMATAYFSINFCSTKDLNWNRSLKSTVLPLLNSCIKIGPRASLMIQWMSNARSCILLYSKNNYLKNSLNLKSQSQSFVTAKNQRKPHWTK